ncbi:uncharacterized protein [Linepithema humile]|uniref:uncharacterized protein n=1 Tax=Linepithema humile TaxID=83485 RepID=UPI00351F0520
MESSRIDMLLGVEVFWDFMCVGQIKKMESQPCWQKTHLGWIVAGGIQTRSCSATTACTLATNEELNQNIKRFWKIEHGARNQEMSHKERKWLRHFEENFKRNAEGKFVAKLPIKRKEMARLGPSKDTAISRFKGLERRLERQPEIKRRYVEFMNKYKLLGHMREVTTANTTAMPHYYLPHRCVIKEENSTTKLRVVFDASCKTASGVSLNDTLLVGPTLQQDLLSIVVRYSSMF